MRTPAVPDNEIQRQQALDETELLNSGADPRFDRITHLCLDLFFCAYRAGVTGR